MLNVKTGVAIAAVLLVTAGIFAVGVMDVGLQSPTDDETTEADSPDDPATEGSTDGQSAGDESTDNGSAGQADTDDADDQADDGNSAELDGDGTENDEDDAADDESGSSESDDSNEDDDSDDSDSSNGDDSNSSGDSSSSDNDATDNESPNTGPALATESATLAVDETTEIDLVLERAPNGMTGFGSTITANASVAAIQRGEIADDFDGLSSVTVAEDGSSISLRGLDSADAVDAGATDVRLATITIDGVSSGTTALNVTSDIYEDDDGQKPNVSTDDGTVEVQLETTAD